MVLRLYLRLNRIRIFYLSISIGNMIKMNCFKTGIYKILFSTIAFLALLFALGNETQAQKVRLRAQINPECSASSPDAKFADIFADGNIAVQGSYSCRGAFIL